MTMYAVVSSGGKQYRVEAGSLLTLERLDGQPGEPGASVTFDRVLLISDGEEITVGTPVVAGASVSATVIGEALGPKLIIFKFKQKVKYRRRNGHRQHLTRVRIDTINPTAARKLVAKEAVAAAATKAAPKRAAASKAKTAKPESAEPTTAAPEVKTARPRTARPRTAKAAAAPTDAVAKKPKARRAARPKAKE
jgi:large subunit ribosomal protein L21